MVQLDSKTENPGQHLNKTRCQGIPTNFKIQADRDKTPIIIKPVWQEIYRKKNKEVTGKGLMILRTNSQQGHTGKHSGQLEKVAETQRLLIFPTLGE